MRPTTGGDTLAQHLADAAAEAARISRLVADSWWDERGREVADRLARVGHDLDQHAQRASRVAEEIVRLLAGGNGPSGTAAPAPRLPSVAGRRENEERGVRLPLWDDDPLDRPPS